MGVVVTSTGLVVKITSFESLFNPRRLFCGLLVKS